MSGQIYSKLNNARSLAEHITEVPPGGNIMEIKAAASQAILDLADAIEEIAQFLNI